MFHPHSRMLSLLHVIDNPEDIDNPARSLPYNAMQWNGHRIIEYVPSKPHNASIHIDPEFVTYTYGSPELTWSEKRGKMVPEKNYSTLISLSKGDIIMFYAAFRSPDTRYAEQLDGYYIFAYIWVDRVIILNGQVIVVGNPTRSGVLKKAVLLSIRNEDVIGRNYYPTVEMQQKINEYFAALNRSSIRKVLDETSSMGFIEYILEKGNGSLSIQGNHIHTIPE